ncbi:MAG: DUF1573 domain-containing protein [Bacteroidales bacterium]|nr:DUF1573 domain-containing protein [Bacteroidales bacterium]NPV36272.1 DUF1573 domain-containing protein [Bacteroidales bacterium]
MKRWLCILWVSLAIGTMGCGDKGNNTNAGELVKNPVSLAGNADAGQMPVIQFDKTIHDFGRVLAGEKISYSFKFRNTGKSDLLITKVSASCGCTVPEWPKTPIAPGEEGYITVTFNTSGRKGLQHKSVTVLANTNPNTTILNIQAEIYQPEN